MMKMSRSAFVARGSQALRAAEAWLLQKSASMFRCSEAGIIRTTPTQREPSHAALPAPSPRDTLHICHTAGHEWDTFSWAQSPQGCGRLSQVPQISQLSRSSAHCNLQPLVAQ